MKPILIVIFIATMQLAFSQNCGVVYFDYYSSPTIDRNGQLFVRFDLSSNIADSIKVEFISIEGSINLVGDLRTISLKNVLPFLKSNRFAEFYIDKKVTNLPKELSSYQWTEAKYFLNFMVNGSVTRTEELRYINQTYYNSNSSSKVIIRNFIKNAQSNSTSVR
jgi:hypothetical protein